MMKKMISLLLVMLMSVSMLALAGCSSNENNNVSTTDGAYTEPNTTENDANTEPDTTEDDANTETNTPAMESAQAFYTEVWAKFAEADKFPCGGGDAEHNTEDGPGQFVLTEENAETFKYLLHVTDELYDMLEDDVSTLQHMMNTNTFCSAVAKLKDPSKAAEFAEGYKTAIQGQRWMCGFPDKVVVISVGDYVVMAYGLEGNINNLVAACSAVEKSATVLVDAPAEA